MVNWWAAFRYTLIPRKGNRPHLILKYFARAIQLMSTVQVWGQNMECVQKLSAIKNIYFTVLSFRFYSHHCTVAWWWRKLEVETCCQIMNYQKDVLHAIENAHIHFTFQNLPRISDLVVKVITKWWTTNVLWKKYVFYIILKLLDCRAVCPIFW